MKTRARALTFLVAIASTVAGLPVAISAAATAPPPSERQGGYRCVTDAFGDTASGRIEFRRVVDDRVTVEKSTSGPVGWRPVSWGTSSANGWPGYQSTTQVVPSTDGKVRLVETEWRTGSDRLGLRVLKVVGRGYPHRLTAFTWGDSRLYWVGKDHALHRITWSWERRRLRHPVRLPVIIRGATALAAVSTNRGTRIYYTDGSGALHVVADAWSRSTDTVVRRSGFLRVTGLVAGDCSTTHGLPAVGLLSADRRTGVARFRRVLTPGAADGGRVTPSVKVHPSGWTWRHLG